MTAPIANALHSSFQSHGIPCAVADELVSVLGAQRWPVGVRLRVLEEDAWRASQILEPQPDGGG